MNASAIWGNTARVPVGYTVGFDLRTALRFLFGEHRIQGIESVRLLSSEKRYSTAHDKVYFVLETHDLRRDEAIVNLMTQFEGVDYDLVPRASAGMVPSAAAVVV